MPDTNSPLTEAELARSNEVALALARLETARARRDFIKSLALVVAAPIAVSGWYAWATNPRIEEDVEFIPITQRGEIAFAYRLEDLPPEARGDIAFTTIWNYVVAREGFSSGTADQRWRIVSLMSDEATKLQYQKDHITTNPASPWARYGHDGEVTIEYDSHVDLAPPTGYTGPPPGYAIRFRRTERWKNKPDSAAIWQTSLRFHRDVPKIDRRNRYEFNPVSLQVWQYPGAVPVSASTRLPSAR